jgi:uncharacterized membrane protein YvlD (DUF360 family)
MRRHITAAVIVCLINGVTVLLLEYLLPGFAIDGWKAYVGVVLAFGIIPAMAWPFVFRLSAIIRPVLFPILTFATGGLVVLGVVKLLDWFGLSGVKISGFWTGVVIAFCLPLVSTVIGAIFSLNDDDSYDWFVVRPLKRRLSGAEVASTPGILFLEIDGLAEPVLRDAMAKGYMPSLKRWVDDGSYVITPWETDLSSQTGAGQAGLLLGNNTDIPAFRWWDKQRNQLVVTSRAADVRWLESELGVDNGLLTGDGASRWNVFSGGASDSIATFSTVGTKRESNQSAYLLFFSNVYLLARVFGLFFTDIVREWIQKFQQQRRNVLPRIHRPFHYAFVRSATTTLMLEASRFMLMADLFRGVPAVYNTFFAYDEVAHHSGITSPDAYKVLRQLDRAIESIERASRSAPRPFRLVVLSDHGQSNGATFLQRYGESLDQLVKRLISQDAEIYAKLESQEDVNKIRLAFDEALDGDQRTARLFKRASNNLMKLEHRDREEDAATTRAAGSDVVVLASGNLGLISFPHEPGRMTFERIVDAHPLLLEGLRHHPGVSFVVVRSDAEGWLAAGPNGIYYLDHGYVDGVDPLAPFGPHIVRLLKAEAAFTNMPDILVMSMFDPETGEVAAFEELVGSHGGVGGTQTIPFVLHPVDLEVGEDPIIGAVQLHAIMKGWRDQLQNGSGDDSFVPMNEEGVRATIL